MKTVHGWTRFGVICALVFNLAQANAQSIGDRCTQAGDLLAKSFYFTNATGTLPQDFLETATADEIASTVIQYCGTNGEYCLGIAPWLLLSSGRLEVRLASMQIQALSAQNFLKRKGVAFTDLKSLLTAASLKPASYSAAAVASVKKTVKVASQNSNELSDLLRLRFLTATATCPQFTSDPRCPFALDYAMKLGRVGELSSNGMSAAFLTSLQQAQVLFTEPKYVQGLAFATLRVLQEIEAAKNGVYPQNHFLEDLILGFEQAGETPKSASDMAYVYLAFYGARGASVEFTSDLGNSENYPVLVSAYLLSTGLAVLDAYTIGSGHPYSLPASLHTSCEYGRPYHFWLSAFLAHQTVKAGNAKRDAVIAAHALGLGYEMFADTVNRVSYLPLTYASDDPSNFAIRTNIAMDDAGAVFGAENDSENHPTNPVEIDQRMATLIAKAANLPPLTDQAAANLEDAHKLEYIKRWEQLFAPNAGFTP